MGKLVCGLEKSRIGVVSWSKWNRFQETNAGVFEEREHGKIKKERKN